MWHQIIVSTFYDGSSQNHIFSKVYAKSEVLKLLKNMDGLMSRIKTS